MLVLPDHFLNINYMILEDIKLLRIYLFFYIKYSTNHKQNPLFIVYIKKINSQDIQKPIDKNINKYYIIFN